MLEGIVGTRWREMFYCLQRQMKRKGIGGGWKERGEEEKEGGAESKELHQVLSCFLEGKATEMQHSTSASHIVHNYKYLVDKRKREIKIP